MPVNEQREETDEEFLARLAANRAKRKAAKAAAEEAAKPQLTLKVSPQIAEAVKADPKSVRVSARADADTSVIDRPEVMEVVVPLEVDGCRMRRAQITTWRKGEELPTVGVVEFADGYRRSGGAVSDYNPLDGLRRPEDE